MTGGSGYFGNVMVACLLAAGLRVRIFDRSDDPDRPSDVEFVQGDIRDREAVDAACRGAIVVYHNVALVPVAKDAPAFWSVNHGGTRNLLAACLDAGVRKVLNTSSSAIFGVPRRNPVDEARAPRGVRQGQARGRRPLSRVRGDGPRRQHHPSAHHHGAGPARHHATHL